jgi:predicted alpha/beta superfamily hydrolase
MYFRDGYLNITNMKNILALVIFLSASLSLYAQDSIHSAILNEDRELRVILPKDYKPGQRFEVFYILDGEWYQELVPFTYNFAESAGYVPKNIFVLVRNRYLNGRNLRDRDFSPTPIIGDSITGGADKFYDFLTKEVVPYIEKKYPASGQRTLLGSSFSGLFSVYAFLKDPAFFQSFIASDPNLNFDNYYAVKIAKRTLDKLPAHPGTLFIAGRKDYWERGGCKGFDSVFRASAPLSLKWDFVCYDHESHYSVQLKAFYDGARFSHTGYSAKPPEYYPANGMVNKSFMVYSMNRNTALRFTTDGSEPVSSSYTMPNDSIFPLTVPTTLRLKVLGNRPAYTQSWTGNFTTGELAPDKKGKSGLRYKMGNRTGEVDSLFKIDPLSTNVLIEGTMEVPYDAAYIFALNGYDSTQFSLGGKMLWKNDGTVPQQSYILSLKKGKYSFRLELQHSSPDKEPHFSIYRSKSASDHWWEDQVAGY